MSYCRFAGNCDIYLYETHDSLICAGCTEFYYDDSWDKVIEHLKWHEAEGDKVPGEVYIRISRQRGRNIGDDYE